MKALGDIEAGDFEAIGDAAASLRRLSDGLQFDVIVRGVKRNPQGMMPGASRLPFSVTFAEKPPYGVDPRVGRSSEMYAIVLGDGDVLTEAIGTRVLPVGSPPEAVLIQFVFA